MREFLELSLIRRGYKVVCAEDTKSALDALEQDALEQDALEQDALEQNEAGFDLVISDLSMPGGGGMEVLRACHGRSPAPITIMMTAYASTDSAVEAMKLGAEDYLVKPFKLDELYLLIERALARRTVTTENQRLKAALDKVQKLDQMVARSPAMERVFELVRKAAPTPSNVLITGESGTGKELIARALHRLSPRKDEPWVPVNCAAIPSALLESELFGHVKGAFTGANQDHIGLFESAGAGTIFLDEIGEMELAMQAKLLRVLQESQVRPVGGSQERALHCRVLCATHRHLKEQVAKGEFREDLYFRLNVIHIEVPALRQRREDIPLLVQHFFETCNAKMGKRLTGISTEAMARFLSYGYPGNIRELENLVERAVALESGTELGEEQLSGIGASVAVLEEGSAGGSSKMGVLEEVIAALGRGEAVDLEGLLAGFEGEIVKAAMQECEGHRKHAAQRLGIGERSLRYRLQKLGEVKSAA